jgi:hypothetical protein
MGGAHDGRIHLESLRFTIAFRSLKFYRLIRRQKNLEQLR